ncbi:hypothetical protein JCM10908_004616 [Rhodotorula pacifica]|uniref:uncharacterized protein n=1 Tax=Rhodotorula pacifica TaxID=1495444 RepID=UPI00317E5C14
MGQGEKDEPAPAAPRGSSTTFENDDPSGWIREGPVRLLQNGIWKRKNGPVACDIQRRPPQTSPQLNHPLTASGPLVPYIPTGIRRKTVCVIGQDWYPPSANKQTVVFIAVLPPPPPPSSSPLPASAPAVAQLDMSVLEKKLNDSGPRPAPLVWVHPLDLQIESRPIKSLRSSEPANLKPKPQSKLPLTLSPNKTARNALPIQPLSIEKRSRQLDIPQEPLPTKRNRRANPLASLQRFTPLEDPSTRAPPTKLAILAALGTELLDIETWRKGQRSATSSSSPAPPERLSYPTSSLRTEKSAEELLTTDEKLNEMGTMTASTSDWWATANASSRRLSTSTASSGTTTASTAPSSAGKLEPDASFEGGVA